MIRLEAVSAGYPGRPVLRDITLDVRPGEVLALVGPNGSGKSTLLKAALGLLPLTGGQVLYDGLPLEKLTPRERARKAALLTQSRNTPSIQALRMVLHGRFPYLAYPRRYGREDEAIARGAMARTGCLELAGENVAQLSGGQRQGVYLAMTLACSWTSPPPIWIFTGRLVLWKPPGSWPGRGRPWSWSFTTCPWP